jgi:transposase
MAKIYTNEFKKEAIKLVTENGYSRSEAARSLGISTKNIYRWTKQFAALPSPITKNQSPEQDEIKRLTKENQRLRLEREILKKAAAFFANEKA